MLENEIWKSARNLPLTMFGNERVNLYIVLCSLIITVGFVTRIPQFYFVVGFVKSMRK